MEQFTPPPTLSLLMIKFVSHVSIRFFAKISKQISILILLCISNNISGIRNIVTQNQTPIIQSLIKLDVKIRLLLLCNVNGVGRNILFVGFDDEVDDVVDMAVQHSVQNDIIIACWITTSTSTTTTTATVIT
ncbi:hypothetical protein DERP_006008 [Dermatophagoides pteronyssinus]|uniref:Uncharacterized protein n=1 Tax=Dermatophagoides pteronyssinus TaxID=6956 RepID=A0ABQ8JSJ4_DERPT|nr:hypothetical protein DERP_006008 [Dermatophagoides pteronyssinus]